MNDKLKEILHQLYCDGHEGSGASVSLDIAFKAIINLLKESTTNE